MSILCSLLLVFGVCFTSDGLNTFCLWKTIIGGALLGFYVAMTYREKEV